MQLLKGGTRAFQRRDGFLITINHTVGKKKMEPQKDDFTYFLKTQATKRKVINMFAKQTSSKMNETENERSQQFQDTGVINFKDSDLKIGDNGNFPHNAMKSETEANKVRRNSLNQAKQNWMAQNIPTTETKVKGLSLHSPMQAQDAMNNTPNEKSGPQFQVEDVDKNQEDGGVSSLSKKLDQNDLNISVVSGGNQGVLPAGNFGKSAAVSMIKMNLEVQKEALLNDLIDDKAAKEGILRTSSFQKQQTNKDKLLRFNSKISNASIGSGIKNRLLRVQSTVSATSAQGRTRLQKLEKLLIEEEEKELKNIKNQKTMKSQKQRTTLKKKDKFHDLLEQKLQIEIKRDLAVLVKAKQLQAKELQKRRKKNSLYDLSFKILESLIFQSYMQIVALMNILLLASDKYPIDKNLVSNQENWNLYFTLSYISELIIKLIAYGPKNYLRASGFPLFDCVIVVNSFIDIIITFTYLSYEDKVNGYIITVLRGTRYVRMFKIARYWREFEVMVETLASTFYKMASFGYLICVVMYIYVLLGLELFANQSKINPDTNLVDKENGISPMMNFDNFKNSFTTSFIVLTNDNQSNYFYNMYRSVSGGSALLYWLSLVIIPQKILLTVFIAILLQNFNAGYIRGKIFEEEIRLIDTELRQGSSLSQLLKVIFSKIMAAFRVGMRYIASRRKNEKKETLNSQNSKVSFQDSHKQHKESNNDNRDDNNAASIGHGGQILLSQSHIQGKSLGLIDSHNKYRIFIYSIISNRKWENFIVIIIFLSGIVLALDTPILDPDSSLKNALKIIENVSIGIFTFETIAKIVSYGFIFNGPYSYLNNGWNVMDFVILIFSYLCLTPLVSTFKVVKAFKIQKALRLIGRNEGLKVALRALVYTIPRVFTTLVIMILFYMIFGVVGVSYFKGKMFYCTEYEKTLLSEGGSKWDCLNAGGIWLNRVYNFDNMANAIISLFMMSTTSGWGENMMHTITSRDIDYLPGDPLTAPRDPAWIFFFVIFMIVGCFVFLNLFVGVVINTFNSEEARVGGSELLTEKQKEWIDMKLLVLRAEPIKKIMKPQNKFRAQCFFVMEHQRFEQFIQACIILNTLVLMLKWYRQPTSIDGINEIVNMVFTVIFTCEALIRVIAMGPFTYFSDGWNIFDTIVAGGSIIGIFVSKSTSVEIINTSLFRAFRILRLLRLLRRGGSSLRNIFNTFVITMQALGNIGSLMILFIYMYSVVGMIYLGETKRIGSMNDYICFESFTSAFITLFTIATGDSWNYTIASFTHDSEPKYDCIIDPSYQDFVNNNYSTIGCGSVTFSFCYFVSFFLIVNLVFLKLFIAIIIGGYQKTEIQDTRLFNAEMILKLKEAWAKFDPGATSYISLAVIRDFLFELGSPLGFDESVREEKFYQDNFIAMLELPTYHNFQSYQFSDVLDALSFRLMVMDHIQKLENLERQKSHELRKNMQGEFRDDPEMLEKIEIEFERNIEVDQKKIRQQIENEINRLLFQKQSENIVAVRELWEKEQKKIQQREKNKDQSGLTSSHHMALEAAIRRVKVILKEKREARALAAMKRIEKKKICNTKRLDGDNDAASNYVKNSAFEANQVGSFNQGKFNRSDSKSNTQDATVIKPTGPSLVPQSSFLKKSGSQRLLKTLHEKKPLAPIGKRGNDPCLPISKQMPMGTSQTTKRLSKLIIGANDVHQRMSARIDVSKNRRV